MVEGADALQSTSSPTDRVEMVAYTPERVEMRTHSDDQALLVLSDSYYPGWTALVDGEPAPIYPTNVLFRGVFVPAGDHTVVMTFRPSDWLRGLWVSAAGVLILVGGLVVLAWSFFRRRPATAL